MINLGLSNLHFLPIFHYEVQLMARVETVLNWRIHVLQITK